MFLGKASAHADTSRLPKETSFSVADETEVLQAWRFSRFRTVDLELLTNTSTVPVSPLGDSLALDVDFVYVTLCRF
jgi:hypothetical protein